MSDLRCLNIPFFLKNAYELLLEPRKLSAYYIKYLSDGLSII